MSMFSRQVGQPRQPRQRRQRRQRRQPREPQFGPVLQMKVKNWGFVSTEVQVRAIADDRPQGIRRVYLYLGDTFGDHCVAPLTEDEARKLAQALLNAIEQSKAFTDQEPG